MSQDCDCINSLKYTLNKIEKNYIGYKYKITPENKSSFIKITDSLLTAAKNTDLINCSSLIQKWLDFFKDEHVYIYVNYDSSSKKIIRDYYSKTPRVNMTKNKFLSYLSKNKEKVDSIEGIWQDEGKNYEIGIIKNQEKSSINRIQFTGFVIKADSIYWLPKQIKFIIEKNYSKYKIIAYYKGDHSLFKPEIKFKQGQINLDNGWSIFSKETFNQPSSNPNEVKEDKKQPRFEVLDSNTCLLSMPSFSLTYKPIIDSLLVKNDSLIRARQHFIIDVRNNGGGSVLCFEKVIPYLYTNPIITKGSTVLATEDNIRDYYGKYDYPNISDSMKAVFKKEGDVLRQHIGELYPLWPSDTLILNTVYSYPKNISIIINENCASSTELFLLKAKQSSKVKLYGTHTMGAVDYSDAVTASLPCPLYKIRYSSSRSNRLPEQNIDNVGIYPDIEIKDIKSDWMEIVRKRK